jgi:hypothetical protein
LTDDERAKELPELQSTGWTTVVGKDAIEKHFVFKDFNQVLVGRRFVNVCYLGVRLHDARGDAGREDGSPPRVVQRL